LLPPKAVATTVELRHNVAVTNGDHRAFDTVVFEVAQHAEVAHHGDNHAMLSEKPACIKIFGKERDQNVTVNNATCLVNGDEPIGISIEGETERRS
jgi:hypothetical protein